MFNKLKSNKKGQDLSISTIIIAALAVVVLVVVIAIFTGRLGVFSSTLGESASAEKTKDSVLNNCIPIDATYKKIDAGANNALNDKNSDLDGCKKIEKAECIRNPNCQWVGPN